MGLKTLDGYLGPNGGLKVEGLSSPAYSTAIVTAAAAAKVGDTGARRLMGVILFGGSADSQVEFKNAATDTGDVLLSLNCFAGSSTGVDLSALGGLAFSTAMFCKPAGTGAIAYVWYE
jgi:hypothetical protein